MCVQKHAMYCFQFRVALRQQCGSALVTTSGVVLWALGPLFIVIYHASVQRMCTAEHVTQAFHWPSRAYLRWPTRPGWPAGCQGQRSCDQVVILVVQWPSKACSSWLSSAPPDSVQGCCSVLMAAASRNGPCSWLLQVVQPSMQLLLHCGRQRPSCHCCRYTTARC